MQTVSYPFPWPVISAAGRIPSLRLHPLGGFFVLLEVVIDDLENVFSTFEDRKNAYISVVEKFTARVVFDSNGIVIDDHYFIERGRINTPIKLLGWVHHLSGKTWVDRDFIYRFISACSAHFGYSVNLTD